MRLESAPGDYAIRLNSLRKEQVIEGIGILRYKQPEVGIDPADTKANLTVTEFVDSVEHDCAQDQALGPFERHLG